MMQSFQEYCENRQREFDELRRILNHLNYGKGLDNETLARMKARDIAAILEELGLGGQKEALQVKSVVSGGTDLYHDLKINRLAERD